MRSGDAKIGDSKPGDVVDRQPAAQSAGLLALARAAVGWERLWPRLWPAAAIGAAFSGVALLDLLPLLPGWLHGSILVGTAAALALVVRRAFWTQAP
ncbi:MAG: DUF4175 domain-containing protein, partial [Alphaproteobacteria bacterium]|nr:DUF4175 domain-containing protein [Alphaproteobacteria bacterium]